MSWSSWATLENEYRESEKAFQEAKSKIEIKNTGDIVDKEILGSMISDVSEVRKILQDKVLYEFNSLSEEELAVLTDRQREIAELRQRYSYKEIGNMLDISPKTVFDVFQKAVRNVKKAKKQQSKGIPTGLSPQQEKIYVLYNQGKRPKEIALIIQSSYGNVRKQLSIINKKVLPKSQEN